MNTVNQFFGSIYKWMAAGVLVSAITCYLTLMTSFGDIVFGSQVIFYGLVGIHFILLLAIQFLINKLPYQWSFFLYFVYAALSGVTISGLIAVYLSTSPMLLVGVFVAAVLVFASLALLGYRTKYDMSGWSTFLFTAVWGVVIVSIINMVFVQSYGLDLIVSAVAMVAFAALTVYDAQYYKNLFPRLETDEDKAKYATLGALHMYVNLLVMFQSLLKLGGFFGGE